MADGTLGSSQEIVSTTSSQRSGWWRKEYGTLIILSIINLLNYTDRYTISGVLTQLITYFDVNDFVAGLFNTAFLVAYLIFAPICGYLGDRYNRKWIMFVGISIWILAVFGCTFAKPDQVWLFMLFRCIVGIGEASYSTCAPAIIADIFTHDARSKALMVFYFAIPVGSGLGYIVASTMAAWTGMWQWGLRVTPCVGIVMLVVIAIFLEEPERAKADHAEAMKPTTFKDDLIYLMKNKTYLISSIGYTLEVFVIGCLVYWAPQVFIYSYGAEHGFVSDSRKAIINLQIGFIACVTGILGVLIGGAASQAWRHTNPRADALICALSGLAAIPFVYLALTLIPYSQPASMFFVFLSITFLCFNWSVLPDMVLYLVVPPRRATATAIQISMSHLFGDATSPLIVGAVADALQWDQSYGSQFYSLQTALYIAVFMLVFGVFFLFISAWYIEEDRHKCEQDMAAASRILDDQDPVADSHVNPALIDSD